MPVALPIPDGSSWWMLPDDLARAHTDELRNEIGPLHPLSGRLGTLDVIAKCDGTDDVLAVDRADDSRVFLVHLTWSGGPDPMPHRYPLTRAVAPGELASVLAEYD